MTKSPRPSSVIMCIGAGGVGKTSVASMLGLHHALRGKKTLVITLDPAKRLMDALGLKGKGDKPTKVEVSFFSTTAKKAGQLYVLMPDIKKEWLDFLSDCIERKSVREKIATNHFYQHMAEGMPGSLEIICCHILYKIKASQQFDVIVLDTPPSSHSIAFFDVPKKIMAVLNESVFQKLMNKRTSFLFKVTKNIAFFSSGIMESSLLRLIGGNFFSELLDFALTIDGLYEPMLERAIAMERLLKHPTTDYVLVVRPTYRSVNDMSGLKKSLAERHIAVSHVIVNQVTKAYDQEQLDREINGLIKADALAITPCLNWYRAMIAMEKRLLTIIDEQWRDIKPRHLFKMSPHDRVCLLTDLLQNFEQGER